MQEARQSWAKQLSVVFVIFLLLGFLSSLVFFRSAPRVWALSVPAALAASLAGPLSWALVCGSAACPRWWRAILAGIAAGVILHPIYMFLIMLSAGEHLGGSDFVAGSFFFFLFGGIVTVPAGVGAATVCKLYGQCCGNSGVAKGDKPD